MSRKTNIGKKPIVKDFGIQSYRKCDKEYPEVIRTPTFKAANDAAVVRESEYAKPYDESEDYSGMEYGAPDWPGFNWPGMDYPDMGWPIPDFPNMYDPWHMNFRCDVSPCWCEGETKTFAANCTYEIINAQFQPPEDDLSVTFSKNTVSITAASGIRDGESGYLTITMKADVPKGGTKWQGKYNPVHGTHSSISVSECSGSECCDDSGMAWAGPETINRNESKSVSITDSLGTGGPYTWTVSGTGFTLDYVETTGLSNMLNADNTACGAAVISVTGCDGNVVSGDVLCSEGQWSGWTTGCKISGSGNLTTGSGVIEIIKESGRYYQQQQVRFVAIAQDPCNQVSCNPDWCASGACLDDPYGCAECLEWACSDYSNYTACQRWCCIPDYGSCDELDGCMCNYYFRWKEWTC